MKFLKTLLYEQLIKKSIEENKKKNEKYEK